MRRLAIVAALSLLSLKAFALPGCDGVIHGTVFNQNGSTAPNFRVTLYPLNGAIGIMLPEQRTNAAGKFRFTQVCQGNYTVIPTDRDSGYPFEAHWLYLYSYESLQVAISANKNQADFPLYLPPKPSFVQLDVVDALSREPIQNYTVKIRRERETSDTIVPRTGPNPNLIAIPEYQKFSLSITAEGYNRWRVKSGKGQLANLAPGATVNIQVRLTRLPYLPKPPNRR